MYRRSLSSSLNTSILAYSSNRDSQGLRRPRFSFFIFTCQTARGPKTPTPYLREVRKTLGGQQMTTDWDRLLFTHRHEELNGHDKLPWPRGQCSAALSGRFIGPPNRRCQRLSSTKLHIESENLGQRRSPFISGLCAVLEPHSCDVL